MSEITDVERDLHWLDRDLKDCMIEILDWYRSRSGTRPRIERFTTAMGAAFQSNQHGALVAPVTVSWELTDLCNLRCRTCYIHGRQDRGQETVLTTQEALRLSNEIASLRVLKTTLTGGEPFLRKDLERIVEALKSSLCGVTIQTNATRISRERLANLAALLDPRTDRFQVSLDGADVASHEAIRGAHSFADTVSGIQLIVETGLPVSINVCPTAVNQDVIPRIYSLANRLGADAFSATPLAPFCGAQDELLPDYRTLIKAEAEVVARSRVPGMPSYLGGISGEFLHWISLTEARPLLDHSGDQPTRLDCDGAQKKLHIGSDGSVYPCVYACTAALNLGNVRTSTLKQIWEMRSFIGFGDRPTIQVKGCNRCDWVRFCRGGCVGLAMMRTGSLRRADPRCQYAIELSE